MVLHGLTWSYMVLLGPLCMHDDQGLDASDRPEGITGTGKEQGYYTSSLDTFSRFQINEPREVVRHTVSSHKSLQQFSNHVRHVKCFHPEMALCEQDLFPAGLCVQCFQSRLAKRGVQWLQRGPVEGGSSFQENLVANHLAHQPR